MKMLAFAVLLLVGCDGPIPDAMVGDWIYMQSSTQSIAFRADDDGNYSLQQLESTSSNAVDDQIVKGTATASGSMLTLVPEEATCPPVSKMTFPYTIVGGRLFLALPYVGVSMDRDTSSEPPAGATVTYGCFLSGSFTPSPLQPAN
jgi:hypothetical protein